MSVVIPAGTAALPLLLAALPAVAEVIVVVGRDDDTTTAAAAPRAVRVIRQTRTGVGNALACGVAESSGDVVVTLAGDGSCDPTELPRYLAALHDGADMAQGSRSRGDGRDLSGGRFSRIGARLLLWLMAVLFGCRRTDPGFGFRAFWRDVAGSAGLPRVAGTDPVRGDGPEIEPLLTVRAAANGLFVTEVPAVAYPRTAPATRPRPLPAARALLGEYLDRRRAARTAEPGSIVVLTGREAAVAPGVLGRTGTDAGLFDPAGRNGRGYHRATGGDRLPVGDDRAARWPATNGSPDRGGRFPEGGTERRRGPRAMGGTPDTGRAGGFGAAGVGGLGAAGGGGWTGQPLDGSAATGRPLDGNTATGRPPGASTPAGRALGGSASAGRSLGDGTTMRRRWRDNAGVEAGREVGTGRRRMQGRPNLRVINGEGGGGGGRTGKLRAVPRPDQDR
ncbi:glycosyltransferase family 2 protein [Actinoplanes oblitus]|uniref:Glycosyltransferase family 2 protein n=1 Tax=Actinoplanes oblitus TaxID=3040509 RepID=A0ABY8WBZ4_9ACTN|nr:glycosyltransferase family 2 protein [Actinoplanes oblitus]WIM94877.1 glycosyltransferase family 2 protein [Actinoplanes oblitus]